MLTTPMSRFTWVSSWMILVSLPISLIVPLSGDRSSKDRFMADWKTSHSLA